MSSEFQLRLYCRDPGPESFEKVKKFVEAGVNVHSRGKFGSNALMCAALGLDRTPNAHAFSYLFNQQKQPLSLDEKIDGLELLGATYILNKEYSKGLGCWLKACRLRSTPKVCIPPDDELPQSPFVKCEWRTSDDVSQMQNDLNSGASEIELAYQAMLVRLRLIDQDDEEHINYLCTYVHDYLIEEDYPGYIKSVLFCLEWAQIHGGSFTSWVSLILRRAIYELSLMSSPEHRYHGICNFSVNIAILDWIAIELDKLLQDQDEQRFSWEDVFLDYAVQLLALLTEMPKTNDENFQLKKRSYELVKSNVRNSDGFNLLLLACCGSSRSFKWHTMPGVGYSPLPSAKVVELLLEVGADPSSVDDEGNTALHVLGMTDLLNHEPSLVVLLLENEVHWDHVNNRGLEPLELLRHNQPAISRENVIIPPAFRKCMSLKCLSAKVLRQNHINFASIHRMLPQKLIEFLYAH